MEIQPMVVTCQWTQVRLGFALPESDNMELDCPTGPTGVQFRVKNFKSLIMLDSGLGVQAHQAQGIHIQ